MADDQDYRIWFAQQQEREAQHRQKCEGVKCRGKVHVESANLARAWGSWLEDNDRQQVSGLYQITVRPAIASIPKICPGCNKKISMDEPSFNGLELSGRSLSSGTMAPDHAPLRPEIQWEDGDNEYEPNYLYVIEHNCGYILIDLLEVQP